jgi:hypothetical protein
MRFALYLLILTLAACAQEKPATPPPAPLAAAPAPALPSIPLEMVQKLWNECTHVDYIFYELPMSMSLDEKASIQYAVRHISDRPAPNRPDCKATGRVTYLIGGDIFLEADFYFAETCTYFVFYQNKQKAYANLMTEEGIGYFKNQIQQGLQLRQQQQ